MAAGSYDGPDRRRLAPVPLEWLQIQFDDLRQENKERHERLRGEMTLRFDEVLRGTKDDREARQDLANRVLIIETGRDSEEKQSAKKGVWTGVFASGGLLASWEILKHLMGWTA